MSSRRGRKGRKPYSDKSRQEELTVTIRGPLLRYVRYLAVLLQPIEEAFPVDEETGEIDRVRTLVNLLDPPREAMDFAVAYLIKEGIAVAAEPEVEEDTFLGVNVGLATDEQRWELCTKAEAVLEHVPEGKTVDTDELEEELGIDGVHVHFYGQTVTRQYLLDGIARLKRAPDEWSDNLTFS